jgi:hypothetical protein
LWQLVTGFRGEEFVSQAVEPLTFLVHYCLYNISTRLP